MWNKMGSRPVSTMVGVSPAVRVFDSIKAIFPGMSISNRWICSGTRMSEINLKGLFNMKDCTTTTKTFFLYEGLAKWINWSLLSSHISIVRLLKLNPFLIVSLIIFLKHLVPCLSWTHSLLECALRSVQKAISKSSSYCFLWQVQLRTINIVYPHQILFIKPENKMSQIKLLWDRS